MGKDKVIASIGSTHKIISGDATRMLRDPKAHVKHLPPAHSLHNGKPPVLGADGHGIWLEKYKPESMQNS